MKNNDTKDTAVVLDFPTSTRKPGAASEAKWGRDVLKIGFCMVPSLLFRAQRRLHLNPTELAVLLQLCDFWWEDSRKPFPSKETLSGRLGISPRQIQRIIARLEEEKLVKRQQRYAIHGGKLSNTYDLSGLVQRLKEIEPDFREADKETKSRRKAIASPGIRKRPKAPV